MIESLLLALLGGAIGGGLTYLFLNNYHNLDDEFFKLQPGHVCLQGDAGIAGAGNQSGQTVIGFVGGLLPAIRAVRMPIASALREL